MRKLTDAEIKFLQENYRSLGRKLCAEHLKVSEGLIGSIAGKLGLKSSRKKISDEEKVFIKENFPKIGPSGCAKFSERSKEVISSFASKNGIKFKKKPNYYIDINQFLDIKDPKIAYILGLIWADGSIKKHHSYEVSVCLCENDMLDLEWIFNSVGNFARRTDSGINGWQNRVTLRIPCKRLHSFLKDNDYVIKSGESPNKILNKIPEELKHYWWRGYFDGDGCFYFSKKSNHKAFISSCFNQKWDFAEKLSEDLKINFSLVKKDYISKKGVPNRSSLYLISNIDGVKKFGDYIYNGFEIDGIGLKRKYNKFLDFKKRKF